MAIPSSGLFRWLLKLYLFPLRFRQVLNFTLNKGFKKQFWEFFDNEFSKTYPHIQRVTQFVKNSSPVIFDIGGGTGTTAEIFLKHFSKSSIYIFEPIDENFQKIAKLFRENKNVIPINAAAGESNYKSSINIARRITSSSILPLASDKAGKNPDLSNAIEYMREESIEVVALAEYLKGHSRIDILKIDVQGFELSVLKGCGEYIRNVGFIVLEVTNHEGYSGSPKYFEIDEYLRSVSFTVSDLFPGIKDQFRLLEWDCIYVNTRES